MSIEWRPCYTSGIKAIGYDEGTGTSMILWQDGTNTAFEKVAQSDKAIVHDVHQSTINPSVALTLKGHPTSKAFR